MGIKNMTLVEELGLNQPFQNEGHETLVSLVLTGEMLTKECSRLLKPFGLTNSQFNVLVLLQAQSVDGVLNQTQLGNMLLVNRSNVTGLIDRMEKAGWVRRLPESEDRRVKNIQLTESGVQLLKQAEVVYNERIEQLLSGVPKSRLAQLGTTLGQIRAKIPRGEE